MDWRLEAPVTSGQDGGYDDSSAKRSLLSSREQRDRHQRRVGWGLSLGGAFRLQRQIGLQTHLGDLRALLLGPLDVTFLHLENVRQQLGRGVIFELARQADPGVVGSHRPQFGLLVAADDPGYVLGSDQEAEL